MVIGGEIYGGDNITANIYHGTCGLLQTDVNTHHAFLETIVIHSYWLLISDKYSKISSNCKKNCYYFSIYLVIMYTHATTE